MIHGQYKLIKILNNKIKKDEADKVAAFHHILKAKWDCSPSSSW
jgi:hypothetical protein